MIKLLALYKAPKDVAAFMEHYKSVHLPLVAKVPGIVKTEVTQISATIVGEPGNFLLAEMYFEDEASFDRAMASAENAAAGKDAMALAGDLVTLMKGEVMPL